MAPPVGIMMSRPTATRFAALLLLVAAFAAGCSGPDGSARATATTTVTAGATTPASHGLQGAHVLGLWPYSLVESWRV
jgi:hypothetical protein